MEPPGESVLEGLPKAHKRGTFLCCWQVKHTQGEWLSLSQAEASS